MCKVVILVLIFGVIFILRVLFILLVIFILRFIILLGSSSFFRLSFWGEVSILNLIVTFEGVVPFGVILILRLSFKISVIQGYWTKIKGVRFSRSVLDPLDIKSSTFSNEGDMTDGQIHRYLDFMTTVHYSDLPGCRGEDREYQPSGEGGTHSPPATPHRLQNPKWPPGGPKMADGVWKGVHP